MSGIALRNGREATAPQSILDFYARPARMTAPGRHAPMVDALRNDVSELARIVQGLLLYDVVAADFYGFAPPDERKSEIHLRSVESMLDRLLSLDDRPLSAARPLDKRLLGRCRHYALLLVALLRAKGIAARARCGFAGYFNAPRYEDHWVCEFWNMNDGRWALADAQLDDVWRGRLCLSLDIHDLPRDRFLVAAEAWDLCRSGAADPEAFGISFAGLRGLWFVAGALVKDVAALNKAETLPWDVWAAQPRPDAKLDDDRLGFFDHLAEVTREPDETFTTLRNLYDDNERLRVPTTVFNALTRCAESVFAAGTEKSDP
jgi:hypothetical protein